MAEKVKQNLDLIQYWITALNELNSIPLENIEWYRGSEKIEIPDLLINRWKFVGMTNKHFAELVLIPEHGIEDFMKDYDVFTS